MENIIITNKLTDEQKIQVCKLVYQGFYTKLSNYWIFEKNTEKGIKVLQSCINYDNGIYAIENDKVVGFIGLQYRKRKFREFNKNTLKEHYGTIGSTWREIFNKFENKSETLKDNEMYIDLIVVDIESRGKGVASQLIDRVTKFSIENKFDKILLDVVNTNKNAIKLYERLGFEIIKTTNFRGLTDFMGFREVFYMDKDIKGINTLTTI